MLSIMLEPLDGEIFPIKLDFEHSLVSLSKWEQKHERPFFGREEKTVEDTAEYFMAMCLTENPPEDFVERLTKEQAMSLAEHINAKASATFFREDQNQKTSSEIITSELVYYWLIQFQIPFWPVETWHLNRLMTLIKIVSIKQSKPKKMSKQALGEQYRQLNAQRLAQSGSSG